MNYINIKTEICSWLKWQIEVRNKKALLVNIDGNAIYSILNYHLCKATQIPIHAVIKSTDTLARQFCIKEHIPHSIFEPFITNIDQLMINVNFPGMNKISYIQNYDKIYELEYTIFISYVAETTNSLYSGNLTRNDYVFIRNFPKVNSYDLLPFINFSETELQEIIKHFQINEAEIQNNTPKINTDLEWIYSLNQRTNGIIEKDDDPTKSSNWFSYTLSQKSLIAKIHQEEKLTRYKKCNAMMFKLNE